MKLTAKSTLVDVALAVGAALRKRGIQAVLTGGACVAVYTKGAYTSRDVDFVVLNRINQATLDEAMASVGFRRNHDRYVHDDVVFYVEFPPPPLSVGSEYNITPVTLRGPSGDVLALSATDICKDRLAAFLHWNDHQGLERAVSVARMNEVDVSDIKRWAKAEGAGEQLNEFLRRIERT